MLNWIGNLIYMFDDYQKLDFFKLKWWLDRLPFHIHSWSFFFVIILNKFKTNCLNSLLSCLEYVWHALTIQLNLVEEDYFWVQVRTQIKICFILICLLTGTAWELPTVLGYAKLWAKCSQIGMSSVWKATSVK